MGHGYHHSRRHTREDHKYHGHDRGRRDHNHYHHDELRKDRVSSRRSSPSPTCSHVSSYVSPQCTAVDKPQKEGNVLENMETSFTDGPLELLKNCVHEGRKVMVWIRNYNGIRGICTGFVLAFDKFWNLLMQDVDEVYQKSCHPKTPFLQSVKDCHLPEASTLNKKKKKKKSAEQPKPRAEEDAESQKAKKERCESRKQRKEEEKKRRARERTALCERNVTKIFVRGDNVVLIRVCE